MEKTNLFRKLNPQFPKIKQTLFSPKTRKKVVKRAQQNYRAGIKQNQPLIEVANMYIENSNLDFGTKNSLQNLCIHNNIAQKTLKRLKRNSAIKYANLASSSNLDQLTLQTQNPNENIKLEEIISTFKLLKIASELNLDYGERTSQNFYNLVKESGFITTPKREALFDKITGELTGVGRYFDHGRIDKTHQLEQFDYVIGPVRAKK